MPCAWFLFKTAQQLFSNLERVRSEGAPQLFTAHVPLEVVLPIALAQICNCWRPPGSFPTSQGEPKFLPSRDRLGVTRLIWQEKGDSQISASPCQISNSGGRIRTYDLRVMSPTSYQTALPRNLEPQSVASRVKLVKEHRGGVGPGIRGPHRCVSTVFGSGVGPGRSPLVPRGGPDRRNRAREASSCGTGVKLGGLTLAQRGGSGRGKPARTPRFRGTMDGAAARPT